MRREKLKALLKEMKMSPDKRERILFAVDRIVDALREEYKDVYSYDVEKSASKITVKTPKIN